jgi:hypothetical protein
MARRSAEEALPRFGTAPHQLPADTEFAGLIRQGLIPPHTPAATYTQAQAEAARTPQGTRPDEPTAPLPHAPPVAPVTRHRDSPAPPPVHPLPAGHKLSPGMPGVHETVVGATGIDDLDPNLEWQLYEILTQPGDPATIKATALAFLRQTAWHQQRYAGFMGGLKAGVFADEASYDVWKGQVNDIFQRYYGRHATNEELAGAANSGYQSAVVGQIAEGHSIASAQSGDWQYLEGAFDTSRLTPQEVQAYGELQAGHSSDLGQKIANRIALATQKMQRIFSGTLANSNLQLPAAANPSAKPDVGA